MFSQGKGAMNVLFEWVPGQCSGRVHVQSRFRGPNDIWLGDS